MLIKYAFECEHVDVLHCFCEDYNIRSRRIWEKNGFTLIFTEEIPQPHKGKLQYHWRLTKDEYNKRPGETSWVQTAGLCKGVLCASAPRCIMRSSAGGILCSPVPRVYCTLRRRNVLWAPSPGEYCALLYRGYIVLSGAEMYYELHHRGSIVLSGPRVYFTQKWRGLILCRNMVWWFGRQVPLQRFIRIKTSQKPQGQNINRENAWKRRGFWKIILKDKFGIVHPFCLCYTENHWGR